MTIDQFASAIAGRIPTPEEFISFVEGQGWRLVRRDDGTPAIRGAGIASDGLAVSTARMLAREPYRTNVLALLTGRWRAEGEAGDAAFLAECDASWADGRTPAPGVPCEWLWRGGRLYAAPYEGRHPAGAWWVSVAGGPWRVVPGRVPLCQLDGPEPDCLYDCAGCCAPPGRAGHAVVG